MNLPDELNDDLVSILGIPNFRCGPTASLMRISGGKIKKSAEVEQAHVLWWLLGLYAKHGVGWREEADMQIQSMRSEAAEQEERQP